MRAFARCVEEDSNLHPVIPDQALTWRGKVSIRPDRASDDLDVATDVATSSLRVAIPRPQRDA
jgi:hypothetical protein